MDKRYWQAIVSCDQSYDGVFYYAVKTTMIYCRPSCRSKTPKRENVLIFHDHEQPRTGGFRPCKRCRPDVPSFRTTKEEVVEKAKAFISAHYTEELNLSVIASQLYVNPFYLRRIFKEETELSPSQYLLKKRIEAALALLVNQEETITDIAFKVGFKSPAHFSTVFRHMIGLPPQKYRESFT
ncbi:bifunctional transcriptional activator/DNA repair enzyme AdaA [Halalkalibacterium halodurans]|uniref:Methylphosphotriester-DNA alkyltransferase (AraC/XylS family) n=1 Tax=Halalkalibacterium halodurans (strain ATCC BAA-125 / DSM 18197 / FERM 7344 / JCM 9153 / C-125) TaxID=272558 RepID=Q9KFT3_HALH5|nr:bifunctional transcriptional activator/DNA repair enzyme AdaA [Halalkalibacterium halodurans]MED4125856.1 bifunctional transcriptional activator/DNA repair enzyme AdaA [Halalkalibacterium halodurans]MED4173588.1 bifunctional transcriptional activator/DNA repair enzyme AdaA [Halalkalibacterium halodurans]BAB04113.1 methylphosphotriester-DNA alkyltransferase (AraC/XylS family) [Halalkalibacterium halodurans C-125]